MSGHSKWNGERWVFVPAEKSAKPERIAETSGWYTASTSLGDKPVWLNKGDVKPENVR